MQPARVDVCQSSSDSAEAQTETKLRNYTTWLTAHRKASVVVCVFTCVRACVPGGGGREWRSRQRRPKREREWKNEERDGKSAATERWDIHHALTNSASVARVRVRAHTNVRECVQRSVSSRRAWNGRERRAVSAPHPEIPFETNPSHRDKLPPSLLSRVAGSFPWLVVPPSLFGQPPAVSTSKALRASHESRVIRKNYSRLSPDARIKIISRCAINSTCM